MKQLWPPQPHLKSRSNSLVRLLRSNRRAWGGAFLLVACVLGNAAVVKAAEPAEPETESSTSPFIKYFTDWFNRVDRIRAKQPGWATPVVTSSPGLQELVRYDISRQTLAGGHTLTSYGSGKGLEFIPFSPVEFIVGIPPWQTLDTSPRKEGWGDESFLMKYRLWSGNEQNGNYIVTAFLGLTVPNGSANYTTHHFVYSPALAAGKGWGDFDVQTVLGVSVPDNDAGRQTLGTPLTLNVAAQYHFLKFLWPEVELNYTYWPSGTHDGLNQVFITPGLVVGRFPIWKRIGLTLGAGYQIAVTDQPLYHHNFIFTGRIPF